MTVGSNFEDVSKMGHMHRRDCIRYRSLLKEDIDRVLMQAGFKEIL